MKKALLGLFLSALSVGGSMIYATNTDCWEGKGTVPTTTYASGIVYGCDENNIPIITIYGDDGKGITIKAMNEGTGTITIGSLNDTGAYGSLYQWGNNYPFPNVADTTTPINSGFSSVSAAGYGPGTQSGYYYSDLWINAYKWDSSNNNNLWGGSGDKNLNGFWGFDTENFEVINATDRQVMCPDGYHIPSAGEWNALLYLWGKNYDENQGTSLFTSRSLNSLNTKTSLNGTGSRFSEDMQIPFVGYRGYDNTAHSDNYGNYWSSSPYDGSSNVRYFDLYPNNLYASSFYYRGNGSAMRCFKNEYIRQTYSLTFDSQGGSEVDTGLATVNTSRTRPADPTKDGYTFVDWYTSTGYEDIFDFTGTLATGDLTVYAKWGCETGYEDNGTGCFATKNIIIQATATEPGQTIKINKYFGNSQKVDWGDGTTGNVYSLTGHTYNESGVYTITLSLLGSNQRWYFQRGYYINYTSFIPKSGTTVTGVKIIYMPSLADGFGSDSAESVGNYFFNYFNDDGAITSLPTGSFDTSNIRNVGESFFDRFNSNGGLLEKLPEGSFDTSNISGVNDFFFAGFNYNGLLTSLPDGSFSLSGITIAKKRYFFHSFNEGGKLTSLPTGSFNTENIETAGVYFFESFNEEGALTSLPKGSFNISNITKVSSSFFDRFNYSGALESLPAGSFNLSGITKTEGLFFRSFNEKGALLSLPQGSFNTTNITEAGGDFFGDFNKNGALEGLPTGSFNTSNITHADYSFFGNFNENGKLKSLPEGSFDVSNIITLEGGTWFFQNFNHNGAITYLPDSFTISSTGVSEGKGYYNAFNSPNYTLNKKVINLVDGITVPLSNRNTFSSNQLGQCGVNPNWLVSANNACRITYYASGAIGGYYRYGRYISNATNFEAGSGISIPRREGYFIEGWYDASGDRIDTIIFPEMNGETFYVKWGECENGYIANHSGTACVLKEYSIVHDLKGGYYEDDGKIYEGNQVMTYTYNPEEDSYYNLDSKIIKRDNSKFIGWYMESGEEFTPGNVPTENSMVYAKYECNLGYIENAEKTACEKIGVKFDANGGKFGNGETKYIVSSILKQVIKNEVKYSHTANIDDEGNQDGNYENSLNTNEIITLTGAESIHVKVIYGGESADYDYVCIWTGNHPEYTAYNNCYTSVSGKLGGGNHTSDPNMKEYDIQGDTVTIAFRSDGGGVGDGYGYYAVISGDAISEEVNYEANDFLNIEQPTRNGYKFIGWYHNDEGIEKEFDSNDITIDRIYNVYAKWEKLGSSGGGGGGGGGGSSSKTDTGSTSSGTGNQINSNTGDIASTGINVKELETNTGSSIQTGSQVDSNTGSIVSSGTNVNNPSTDTPGDSIAPSQNDKTYSTEFQEAYEFAKGNGITTMPTIQKANMEGKLTRIAMAKMLSQYAINVLGKTPDTTQNNKFNDVTDKLDSDYDDGVTLAYQLGIMGQNMPGNNFRPDDEVTRAEFATALSRMLYNTSDGQYKSTDKYYTNHMSKLVKEGIITKDDPKMKELRGYVMIMLMRSAK